MEDWSGFGSHRQWDFKFLELIFFFHQNSLTLTVGHWKNVKAVEFSCLALLTLEWSNRSTAEGVLGLCTSVFAKHTILDGAMGAVTHSVWAPSH